ncbi:MAG: bifunctional homocysteine S-methyltransferase/methylenetetrahydrofolate reductase [Anaerolineae bacterium]|jgi:methionine synthase I (cobalamin-dependent)/5,10-methylenetetrahydrofolate reductase
MVQHPFLERLQQGPILNDGAMGTQLYARGVLPTQCYDALNLSDAELVQRVHMDYLAAGAEIIETNTFGANGVKLAAFGLEGQVRAINRQGGRIARYARDIAGSTAFIAGAIGPLGGTLAPLGELTEEQALALYREQVTGLIDGGVDLFVLETFGDLNLLCIALQAVRELTDLPIIAQATFDEDGRTPRGQTATKVATALLELEADVLGANCSVGPEGVLNVVRDMLAAGARYVAANPNAGMPTQRAGRLMYLSNPAYFAARVPDFIEAGVTVIGGCCGTGPEHIAAMRVALDALRAGGTVRRSEPAIVRTAARTAEQAAGPRGTALSHLLAEGRFVTAVELSPPRSLSPAALLRHARALAESGQVDLINVTDSPMARVRMDALAACNLIQAQTGIETVLHLTTRDRSLMGIQSHLIGAHALGVRNILALTGDPPSLSGDSQSTGVYDIDSVGLVRVIDHMKQGHDLAGSDMGSPADFCVGVAVDPTREDLAHEAQRLREKIAAGAEFIMTQPIYDLGTWDRFLEVFGESIPIPVLMGLLPLLSQRHAEFLHNEIPGITLTEETLERMRQAGANGREEGVRLGQELLLQCRQRFQGVYLMPSYNRHDLALDVLSVLDQQGEKVAN